MEELLQKKFKEYYSNADLAMPRRFTRREYGFMFFGKNTMMRHISFSSSQKIKTFLADKAPAHVFYSSAYYSKPYENDMKNKGWLGADLIFDLDADHLSLPENCTYEKMLSIVKRETKKLVEDFLIRDFGFKDLELVFSGSRGYHIHIYDKEALDLGSRERREIIDYITGNGISLDLILGKENYAIPSGKEPGWYGKIGRAVREYADRIVLLEKSEAVAELKKIEGVGERKAEKICEGLKKLKGNPKIVNALPKEFIEYLKENVAIELSKGEADEPVTSDIHRLIRFPTSLHGKTGFIVKPLSFEDFDDFDPLQDAIAFGDEFLQMRVLKPFSIKIKDFHANVKGGIIEMPEYAAVFACARGLCAPA
ncbi:MAG: DNA primase catalytic subunit PriS [Candidatus Thermoplasmatota archaeon]|nr:DNA primase catalytic subunit PriS [Candidatus Thermoplasmatota archaeon]